LRTVCFNVYGNAVPMVELVGRRWYSPNSTWLATSRLDVSITCTLAVSSLSNSTARHARLDALDMSNVSSRVETWRDEPSGIWAYVEFMATACSGPLHGFAALANKIPFNLNWKWPQLTRKTASLSIARERGSSCRHVVMLADLHIGFSSALARTQSRYA